MSGEAKLPVYILLGRNFVCRSIVTQCQCLTDLTLAPIQINPGPLSPLGAPATSPAASGYNRYSPYPTARPRGSLDSIHSDTDYLNRLASVTLPDFTNMPGYYDVLTPSNHGNAGTFPSAPVVSGAVYTDGACFWNGKYNTKGGIGVFWGDGDSSNVSAPVTGPPN